VRHRTGRRFWQFYDQPPPEVQDVADKNFELLKQNPKHPSLHFKNVGRIWSARVGSHHRAAAVQEGGDMVGFWIGRPDEYVQIIAGRKNS
jgi:hypothetical protein